MRYLLSLLLGLWSLFAQATQFNVYLKYEDSALKQNLQAINHYLEEKGLLSKYHIKPFLNDYPLHTTLYLTDFESYSIPYVIDILKATVSHWYQFPVKTANFVVTAQGYVMLDLAYEPKPSGLNPIIQSYSDEIVMKLMGIRDTTAPIPDWAKQNPVKLKAYQRYGSPNVFFEFSPHFTLMAKKFKDPKTASDFEQEIKAALAEYQASHDDQTLQLTATALGLGYVNEYGQITREIISFPLKP